MLLRALTLIAMLFQATPVSAPAVLAPAAPASASTPAAPAPKPRPLLEILDDPRPVQAEPQTPAQQADDGKMRCRRTDNGFVCGSNEDDMRANEDLLRSMFPR